MTRIVQLIELFLKQTNSGINIISYFIGISKIIKGSFKSIQTFFTVVSNDLIKYSPLLVEKTGKAIIAGL